MQYISQLKTSDMKNRFLPFRLITAFAGLSLLLFSVLSMAGQPGNPDLRKYEGSRLERIRANQKTGLVNPQDVMKARNQVEALSTKATSAGMNLNWLSAGPDNYTGKVRSTIFDNTDATGATLIAGAVEGGIWKSTDLGLTWKEMPVENEHITRVSSLVQAANGTIYAATGVAACGGIVSYGDGIYRSVGGGTFSVIPATQSNPDFDAVSKMAIDPQSGRLFAATVGGLYYSDNGENWTNAKSGYAMDVIVGSDGTVITAVDGQAYMAPASNLSSWVTLTTGLPDALPNTGIGWMVFAIAPSDANIIYASLAGTDSKLLNIYTSTDKGLKWSIIFPKNTAFEPFSNSGCYANTIAVSPTDPNMVYLGGINMWQGRRIQPAGYFNWELVSYGYYSPWANNMAPALHHSYAFRPNNPNQMAISTDCGVSICTIGSDTVTFKTINKTMPTSQFNAVSFSAQKGYVMGGGDGVGTLAMGFFYPERFLYNQGVNSPTEGFPLWYTEGLTYGGYGGTCEWSSIDSRIAVYTKLDGSPATRRRDLTDLTYENDFVNGVRPVDSSYIPMRLWESFNFAQTHDSVKFYARVIPIPADTTVMIESASNKFKFPYVTTAAIPLGDSIVVADPIASRLFYYGKKSNVNGIFMTKDMLKFNKDAEFFMIYKDTLAQLAQPDFISTMAISADLNTLWAGTVSGRLIRVSGLLQAYDSATAIITSPQCVLTDVIYSYPGMFGRYITSISISPANSNQVLVTLGNYGNQDYVYFTQDGNAPNPVFTSIQGNLPAAPVYSGLIEMAGNNALVGTDYGVFSISNLNTGTPQWAADMKNVGDVRVTDIRQQVIHDYHILNYGVIYLASYGRGLWMDTTYQVVGIDPMPVKTAAYGALKLNPNPVKDVVNISYANETSCSLAATVYDLAGRIILSTGFGNQPKGTFTGKLVVSSLPQGTYIVKVGNGVGKIVKL
jgi:hypothetical protein